MTGPRVDPYADLYDSKAPRPAEEDPYADLVAGGGTPTAASGDVDLRETPRPPARPETPPVFAPRDVTAIPLAARQHYRAGIVERTGEQLAGFVSGAVQHPIETAKELVVAPARSLLQTTGGAIERAFLGAEDIPDAERAVPDKEYDAANAQTIANMAFGPIEGAVSGRAASLGMGPLASKIAGLTAAGAPAGAAYTPNDPAAGAITGGLLAAVMGAAHEGAGRAAPIVRDAAMAGGRAGRELADRVLRPADATPGATRPETPSAPTFRRRVAGVIDPTIATELRGAQRAAETDALTGAGNRAALDRALPAAEADPSHGVAVFDANNFGQINKRQSQQAGDAAIQDIGAAIQQAAQEHGVGGRVFRRGGDEFVVLAPADRLDAIRQRAEELFGERIIGEGEKAVTVSLTGTHGPTFAEADALLQQAKQARKARQGGVVLEPSAPSPADLRRARQYGATAARAGDEATTNPYRPESPLHQAWHDGHAGVPAEDVGAENVLREHAENLTSDEAKRIRTDVAIDEGQARSAKRTEATSIADAKTGQPLRTTLLRGQGAASSPYNPLGAQVPILGEGRYGTLDRTYAEAFGPNVTQHATDLRNPLVIDSDQQWRALTQRAGWEFPNPFGQDPAKVATDIARLRSQIEGMGHDGVVVRIPADERTGKTLGKVFGADQVVEFNPSRETGAVMSRQAAQEPAGATEPAGPYADLFGEREAPKEEQGALFGEQAGTAGSRPLASAERAARAELETLRTRFEGTTDPVERQQVAARMAELEKLTNRDRAIRADELGHRAAGEADPYGDLTGERPATAARAPSWLDEETTASTPDLGSGVVLEDGEQRFASARTPGGARRNPARVSTPGLLDELLELEQRRADAEARAVYEVRDDPNFHTSGIPQIVSTKERGGPSRQAKALTNLDAFERAQTEIEAALAARGISGHDLTDMLRDHYELREERRALAGDFDPGNMKRGLVRDEATGEPLFSQTPDAFASPPSREAGRDIASFRAQQKAASETPAATKLARRPLAPPGSADRVIQSAALRLNAYKDAVQRVFAPASRSPEAGTTALGIREHNAAMAHRNELAREAVKEYAGLFDRMPQAERYDFIDRMEAGRSQPTPELEAAARTFRYLLDTTRDAIRALGTGKLEHWITNYFPHLWVNAGEAVTFIDRVMSKRSLSGPGTFLKRRSIPTFREGIEAGLEPLTTNPVDMTLLKLREMNKYLAGQHILAELKQQGFAKFVNALEHPPAGLVKLDDKLGTIYGPPHVTVTEGFDKLVREKLSGIMQELGVEHHRVPKIGGRGRMGFAEGDRRVVTKAGGPDTVIEHELGHILDKRLNVWARLTDIPGKTREAIDTRKQLHTELRTLADMRMEDQGEIPASFKTYLRKKEEKIANAVHALVYMPERMEEVAPLVKARLTDILRSHPVAAKMLDVKPSLVLGTSDFNVPVGGLVVKGHWYVPEPVARVVNNYLSPGLTGNPFFDLYRGVGNAMNQWQLGFSAFHLGFTSMDAAVSKTALAVEQLAAGRPLDAGLSLAKVPVSPFTNYLQGSKLLREYLRPGTEGGEMADIVNALVQGGGRVRMDEFYGGGAVKQMREALNAKRYGKAARLSLPALTDAASHLIMAHIVPRQKLGVFADLARFELSRLPETATKDDVRRVMANAWDSVDNRMGQLVYDNLFWDRVAKDLTMASVRSVGWNIGTIRELGGGIADLPGVPRRAAHRGFAKLGLRGDWQGATEPLGLSHRAAYVVALPITVGMAGAVLNYLYTGQEPRELKDYFYPRTGRKNPDGTDERVQLPSYIRDVGDYGRHPVQTLVNKMHPLAGTIRDMLQNEDYYGHQIHNPDDPMVQQIAQEAEYTVAQFEPLGVHNARQQFARGQRSAAALNFIGITPAPREETRTPADLRMSEEMGRRARGNLTPEEVDRQQTRRGILNALRGRSPDLSSKVQEGIQSGAVAPSDLSGMLKSSVLPPDVERFKRLPLAEAARVYGLATPAEKARYGPILLDKIKRSQSPAAPELLQRLSPPR